MAKVTTETPAAVEEQPRRKSVGYNYIIVLLLLLGAIAFYIYFAIPEFRGILEGVGLI